MIGSKSFDNISKSSNSVDKCYMLVIDANIFTVRYVNCISIDIKIAVVTAVVAAVMFTVDYVRTITVYNILLLVVPRSHLFSVARCAGRPSVVPMISPTWGGVGGGKLSHPLVYLTTV